VAGHRIQRFHFAPKTRRGARIDQRLAGSAKALLHIPRAGKRPQWRAELEVRLKVRRFSPVSHFTAAGLPGLQAAIEHGDCLVARPLQHPPQAAAVVAAVAVVDHCLHVVGKTDAGQPHREFFAAGQRVSPARGSIGVRVMRAVGVHHALVAQGSVQVGIHRAGNVGLAVLLLARRRVQQVEAAVEDHQRRA
jgi:hypothetical protein